MPLRAFCTPPGHNGRASADYGKQRVAGIIGADPLCTGTPAQLLGTRRRRVFTL